jgi:hypothetical protein
MPNYLQFYKKERIIVSPYYNIQIEDKIAFIIINKIKRHFKFIVNEVSFNAYKNGTAFINSSKIRIPSNTTIGMVLHELAHLYNFQKFNNYNHNKKLLKTILRFYKYCIKLNWWRLIQLPEKPKCHGKDVDICFSLLCPYLIDCEKLCGNTPKQKTKNPDKVILGKWLYYKKIGGVLSFQEFKSHNG